MHALLTPAQLAKQDCASQNVGSGGFSAKGSYFEFLEAVRRNNRMPNGTNGAIRRLMGCPISRIALRARPVYRLKANLVYLHIHLRIQIFN